MPLLDGVEFNETLLAAAGLFGVLLVCFFGTEYKLSIDVVDGGVGDIFFLGAGTGISSTLGLRGGFTGVALSSDGFLLTSGFGLTGLRGGTGFSPTLSVLPIGTDGNCVSSAVYK